MCDCELQICCCKECESAFKNSVTSTASALTNQDVLVYATASASASSEISFQDAWLKADVEANRLAKYYAELEANTIDTTFNIIQTEPILTFGITNTGDIVTDYLTVNNGSITTGIINRGVVLTESLIVSIDSTTNGITNTGNIETDTINNIPLAQTDSNLLDVIIGDYASNVTTASSNTGLGVKVFENLTTGSRNVAVGLGALASSTTGGSNVAVGLGALASSTTASTLVAVGYNALNANVTGFRNTALGYQALTKNTDGDRNTAVGQSTLLNNTIGDFNTALGFEALKGNTTGNNNIAIGGSTLDSNTNGSANTAIGNGALTANNGDANVALGYKTLNVNTTGSNNVALGNSVLLANTTGDNNTALGVSALSLNVSGSRNTAIGYNADTTGQYDESIAIGYNARIRASNQIVLGTLAETLVIRGGLNYNITTISADFTLSTPVNQFYIVRGTTTTVTLPYLSSNANNWGAVAQFKNMTAGNVNLALPGSYTPSATANALIAKSSIAAAASPIVLASGAITQYIFGPFINGSLVECGAWYQQF